MNQDQNLAQEQVVQTLDRHILLLAPAGTGKTDSLARRIANILNQRAAAADQILCLTFTNRACKEIKERVAKRVAFDSGRVTVKTFHSFCCEIIRLEAKRQTDIPEEFTVFDEEDCLELIRSMIHHKQDANPLQKLIGLVKSRRICKPDRSDRELIKELCALETNPILRECSSYNGDVNEKLYENFLRVGDGLIKKYDSLLREQAGLDFNDLQVEASRLLLQPAIAQRWTEKFRFIHIDEVQDTSLDEYGILTRLFSQSKILVCGDYFQTIYEWRGSQPENVFERFCAAFDPIRVHFNKNYRATNRLLRASHGYLLNAFAKDVIEQFHTPDLEVHAETEGDLIEIRGFLSVEEEAHWIYQQLQHKPPSARVAILTRTNKLNADLSECFAAFNERQPESKRLKFLMVDEFKFFRRQEVKDLLAYLKLVVNKYDDQSLQRILKRFHKSGGVKAIEQMKGADFRAAGLRMIDVINPDTNEHGEPYSQLLSALDDGRIVVFDVETNGRDLQANEILQIAAIKIDAQGRELARFERFLKIKGRVGETERIHGFSDAFLAERGEDPVKVLHDFAQFLAGAHIVGHNVQFDIDMLRSQLIRCGLPFTQAICFDDTANLSRRFNPTLPNHKLETLCAHFQTQVVSDHNALHDVLATSEVLIRLIETRIRPEEDCRRELLKGNATRFASLTRQFEQLRVAAYTARPLELIDQIIELSGINDVYRSEENRLNNIEEFRQIVAAWDRRERASFYSVRDLLQITALSNTELDRLTEAEEGNQEQARIPIITVHQAKGAEFDWVCLAGAHENSFPSYTSKREGRDIEERRLFYVALTRAKRKLSVSWSKSKYVDSESPYLAFLPREFLEWQE